MMKLNRIVDTLVVDDTKTDKVIPITGCGGP
jgi:hypothetical protein